MVQIRYVFPAVHNGKGQEDIETCTPLFTSFKMFHAQALIWHIQVFIHRTPGLCNLLKERSGIIKDHANWYLAVKHLAVLLYCAIAPSWPTFLDELENATQKTRD